jgi:integrase
VSEVANLKIRDIDSDRMVVIIRQGKGRKDRITGLSYKMLEQFREYYKIYRPEEWLFENPTKPGPISARTLQNVFNQNKNKAGIRKACTFHSLRHYVESFIMVSKLLKTE